MIEIRVTNTEALDKLKRLAAKGRNLSPFMKKAAGIMDGAIEDNFEEEGRPRWPDLAESTKKQRAREGKWPGKMLQRSSAGLASSISRHYDDTSAAVGTNKTYAAIQHLGGKAGRGKKVEIPARAFLILGDDDEHSLGGALREFLQEDL